MSEAIDQYHSELYEADQLFENQIVMTVRDASIFLKCSTKKIYQLVGLGQIPYKRVGREIRFYLPELQEWLKGG